MDSKGHGVFVPLQVVRVVSGELHAATDSTDVAIEVWLLLCGICTMRSRAGISFFAAWPCLCALGGVVMKDQLSTWAPAINRRSSRLHKLFLRVLQRLAIEEGLDAPDGRHSELHAADAVSRTEIQPTSGANRGAGPPSTGKSGR